MKICRLVKLFGRENHFGGIFGTFSLSISAWLLLSAVVAARSSRQWLFLNFGASSAGRMVVNSLMTLEMDADVGVDPVEEMRLRTWARKHYAPMDERDESWHPIVLDEMERKDQESNLMAFSA